MSRVEITQGGGMIVTLSKRNLLALLHKVDQDWSTKTIGCGYVYIDGQPVDPRRVSIMIRCESDDAHYIGREAPGEMIEETEEFIEEHSTDER